MWRDLATSSRSGATAGASERRSPAAAWGARGSRAPRGRRWRAALVELVAQLAKRPVETPVDRRQRLVRDAGDLGHGEVGSVAEIAGLALLGRQRRHRALDRVAPLDELYRTGAFRARGREDGLEGPRLRPGAPALVSGEVERDRVQPRLLASTAAIEASLAPQHLDERLGDEVLGELPVARLGDQEAEQPMHVRPVQALDVPVSHFSRGPCRESGRSFVLAAMTFSHNSPTPPGLDEVEDGLRGARALPTDDEVDRIWTRVAPVRVARTRARGARMALVAVLAGGLFVGGGSGALAISGSSNHGNVAAAQYQPTNPNGPQVLGQVTGGGPTPTTGVPTTTTATTVSPTVAGDVGSPSH